MATHLATKVDLDSLRFATRSDVELLRHDMNAGFAAAHKDLDTGLALLRKDMDALASKIVIRLGALIVAVAGLMLGAVQLGG